MATLNMLIKKARRPRNQTVTYTFKDSMWIGIAWSICINEDDCLLTISAEHAAVLRLNLWHHGIKIKLLNFRTQTR